MWQHAGGERPEPSLYNEVSVELSGKDVAAIFVRSHEERHLVLALGLRSLFRHLFCGRPLPLLRITPEGGACVVAHDEQLALLSAACAPGGLPWACDASGVAPRLPIGADAPLPLAGETRSTRRDVVCASASSSVTVKGERETSTRTAAPETIVALKAAACRRIRASRPSGAANDTGLFWDFCSLPQRGQKGEERSEAEKSVFAQGLGIMGSRASPARRCSHISPHLLISPLISRLELRPALEAGGALVDPTSSRSSAQKYLFTLGLPASAGARPSARRISLMQRLKHSFSCAAKL